MSPRPYRELALVPSVVEPTVLWPWAWQSKKMGGTSGCPKCKEPPTVASIEGRLCVGRTRFWPFRKACLETREHFHVRCRVCGWTTLMATADAT